MWSWFKSRLCTKTSFQNDEAYCARTKGLSSVRVCVRVCGCVGRGFYSPDQDFGIAALPAVFFHDHGPVRLPRATVDHSGGRLFERLVEFELLCRPVVLQIMYVCFGRKRIDLKAHLSNPRASTLAKSLSSVRMLVSPCQTSVGSCIPKPSRSSCV